MRWSVTLLTVLLAVSPAASANAASAKKPRVAVLDIRPLGTEQHKADLVSEVALTEAASLRDLEVIGRSDIIALIGFQKQKEMLGCAEDSACIAEIGGALGVDYVVLGSLGRLGTLTRLDLKLVESKRARVLERFGDSIADREESLVASVQRGIRTLLATIPRAGAAPGVALPPPPPATRPAEAEAKGSGRRILAWTLGGAGLAAVGGGATFGILAKQAYDSEKAATDGATYDRYRSLAKDRVLYANVLYGIGAVGLGAGAWLYFTGGDDATIALGAMPLGDGALAFVAGDF